jgi:hypothetical protein
MDNRHEAGGVVTADEDFFVVCREALFWQKTGRTPIKQNMAIHPNLSMDED